MREEGRRKFARGKIGYKWKKLYFSPVAAAMKNGII